MDELVSTAGLQRLMGVGKPELTELVARGIVQRGDKRGTYNPRSLGQRLLQALSRDGAGLEAGASARHYSWASKLGSLAMLLVIAA